MQKRHLNIVLIIVVIAVWGGLIYKFASPFFNTNKTTSHIPKVDLSIKETQVYSKDTFQLTKVIYDPFLAKSYSRPIISTTKKSIKKKKKPKKLVWPKINYLGFVKSQTNKNKLGLIRVNNHLCKVRPGDQVKTIKVYKITNDSIGLKLGTEKKFFTVSH